MNGFGRCSILTPCDLAQRGPGFRRGSSSAFRPSAAPSSSTTISDTLGLARVGLEGAARLRSGQPHHAPTAVGADAKQAAM
jgi:hypothetical protein